MIILPGISRLINRMGGSFWRFGLFDQVCLRQKPTQRMHDQWSLCSVINNDRVVGRMPYRIQSPLYHQPSSHGYQAFGEVGRFGIEATAPSSDWDNDLHGFCIPRANSEAPKDDSSLLGSSTPRGWINFSDRAASIPFVTLSLNKPSPAIHLQLALCRAFIQIGFRGPRDTPHCIQSLVEILG